MKAIIIVIALVLGLIGLVGVLSGQPILMSIGLGGFTFALTVGSNVG